jgi:hypothetical protein
MASDKTIATIIEAFLILDSTGNVLDHARTDREAEQKAREMMLTRIGNKIKIKSSWQELNIVSVKGSM